VATSSASSGWARPEKSISFFSPVVLIPVTALSPQTCRLPRTRV
jgi:hypothetical protein